jgi:hypothetical protein
VAREEELAEIHGTLCGDGSRRTVVLCGLGGIGKTQLTIAYAKRHKDNYSAVFWLNIKDEDSLKESFVKAARQILREHPSASRLSSVDIKENLNEVIDAVKEWLSLPNNTRYTTTMITQNWQTTRIPRQWISTNFSLDHIKDQSSSQHGRRKSRSVILSKSESWRMCAIVSRFYRIHRDEKGS